MNILPEYGFAFPVSTIEGFTQHGLTKREVFAMAAMQGLLSNPDVEFKDPATHSCAIAARKHADALLAELSK